MTVENEKKAMFPKGMADCPLCRDSHVASLKASQEARMTIF